MMDALEPLTERDIFLDVGAGIGNVLAQVALATKVSKCIGVEVRVHTWGTKTPSPSDDKSSGKGHDKGRDKNPRKTP
ncbi:hypothetical protein PR003_g10850 [Phytophthora rubi]|uniref:DOT1 domain-containing protein n=1 Tax=Phytophthora rubi TaxID=129364 RepID=A0A6A4FPX8_9STRA|nr:hypothetical protein PR003_g10850 [Phytophthora rubi]